MTLSFKPILDCPDCQPFVECCGFDISADPDSGQVSKVKEALLRYGLVVFRNQHELRPEHEVRFNQLFGWHDPDQKDYLFGFGAPSLEHKVSGGAQLPDWPQVSVLGNVLLKDYWGLPSVQLEPRLGFTYSGWHADGLHDMFDGMPEMTTMYNPSGYRTNSGGKTLFTSSTKALQRLDKKLQSELSSCTVAYMRCPNDDLPDERRTVAPGSTFMINEGTRRIGFAKDISNPSLGLCDFELRPEHADGGGEHPCIRTHPVTKEQALYFTPGRAIYLRDSTDGTIRHNIEATADLLSAALLPSVITEVRYEHQWREGDFVAWLNTLVLHTASDPEGIEGDRLLHRVRLSTPKTRWKDGRYIQTETTSN
jgi:alpha-ketoglutarate-dependent taurine dioxygenase